MNSPLGAVPAPPLLEVQNLVVGYGQKALIRNLFFALPEPAFVAIIGHNGSGKTTLFKALLGQVPYSGSVNLAGKPVAEYTTQELAGLRAYLPQKNELQFPVTVLDLVVMGRYRLKRFFEHYSPTDYEAAQQALAVFGVQHLDKRDINQLSGGEQQLVWLAQLLVQDAQLWLLDEPAHQLDVYHRRRLYKLLNEQVTLANRTILCITHDLESLPRLSGYLLNLSKPEPKLEMISPETVEENLHFLEEKPFA